VREGSRAGGKGGGCRGWGIGREGGGVEEGGWELELGDRGGGRLGKSGGRYLPQQDLRKEQTEEVPRRDFTRRGEKRDLEWQELCLYTTSLWGSWGKSAKRPMWQRSHWGSSQTGQEWANQGERTRVLLAGERKCSKTVEKGSYLGRNQKTQLQEVSLL